MCHIRMRCFILAILACLPMMRTPAAQAQTAAGIEQAFSGSLTAMPSEILGVSGAFYVPAYSGVVDWAATGEIAEPVVEALMFGGLGSGHYAFISQGRPLKVVGKN